MTRFENFPNLFQASENAELWILGTRPRMTVLKLTQLCRAVALPADAAGSAFVRARLEAVAGRRFARDIREINNPVGCLQQRRIDLELGETLGYRVTDGGLLEICSGLSWRRS